MKFIALVFLLFYAPAAFSCEIKVLANPGANFTVVKWTRGGLVANRVCSTMIVTPTRSSGQKDSYHKLGDRNTVIIVPDGLEAASSADIIYWFHGLTGFKEKTFKKRLAPQYSWLVNDQSWPAILVVTEMPWSYFTRTQWKRQGRVFRKPDEFYNYTREVEAHVMRFLDRQSFRFDRIIVGHSAGGSAIASAALYGGLCKAQPVGVVFSDSTYGGWFKKSWDGCLKEYSKKSRVRIMVLGQASGTPWKKYNRWAKFSGSSHKRIEAYRLPFPWTHSRIGNNAIPFFYHRFISDKYEDIYESR